MGRWVGEGEECEGEDGDDFLPVDGRRAWTNALPHRKTSLHSPPALGPRNHPDLQNLGGEAARDTGVSRVTLRYEHRLLVLEAVLDGFEVVGADPGLRAKARTALAGCSCRSARSCLVPLDRLPLDERCGGRGACGG